MEQQMAIKGPWKRHWSRTKKPKTEAPESVICPYCEQPAKLVDSAEIYGGRSYGWAYLCSPCRAYVGCHDGTKRPLGRLANADLRAAKIRAHDAFDKLWRGGAMSRSQAY